MIDIIREDINNIDKFGIAYEVTVESEWEEESDTVEWFIYDIIEEFVNWLNDKKPYISDKLNHTVYNITYDMDAYSYLNREFHVYMSVESGCTVEQVQSVFETLPYGGSTSFEVEIEGERKFYTQGFDADIYIRIGNFRDPVWLES